MVRVQRSGQLVDIAMKKDKNKPIPSANWSNTGTCTVGKAAMTRVESTYMVLNSSVCKRENFGAMSGAGLRESLLALCHECLLRLKWIREGAVMIRRVLDITLPDLWVTDIDNN